jgi:hypothetical protein
MAAIRDAASHAWLSANQVELAQAGVLACAHAILDAGVEPVGGVDVGRVGAPAPPGGGQVGDPQAVPPAVFGLEQGQLGARMRALAAGEDAHRGGPAVELVTAGAFARRRSPALNCQG